MKHLYAAITAVIAASLEVLAQSIILPAPVVHGNSFEILSNSRYSAHSGFTSTLSTQVVSNVLWAMNRVPRLGSYREFYVATPTNVYRYDSVAHALNVHLSGNHRYNAGAAYEIGIACDRYEEAGYAVQAGLLAGVAFWNSSGGNVAGCPMAFATTYANSNWNPVHPIKMVDVFGQATPTGLVTTVQAVPSDSSLSRPRTTASDTFEVLLSTLHQDSIFSPSGLTRDAISQLLWAGYGVTPHAPSGNRGLTVPSAYGTYYLTRRIYFIRDTSVQRYNNRLPPGTGLTTSDHRLEHVSTGDRRPLLRAACPRIPSTAPDYIVVCVGDTAAYGPMIEAGLAGLQYLMQANSLGLLGFLTAPITPAERSGIISALGIPATDLPVIVFSCGEPLTGTRMIGNQVRFVEIIGIKTAAQNSTSVLIDYRLAGSGRPAIVLFDLAGRPVRHFRNGIMPAGANSIVWDGAGDNGNMVPAGAYFCRITAGGDVFSARFILSR